MLHGLQSTIDGVSPFASWRFPGPTGYAIAPVSHRPFDLPATTDLFIPAMGASREQRLDLASYGPLLAQRNKSPADWGIPAISIRYDSIFVGSCDEAHEKLAARKTRLGHIAMFHPKVRDTAILHEETEAFDDGQHRHTQEISIRIDVARSFITFPELIWDPISDRERDALRQFYLDLMVHELGHFWIAGMILWYAQKKFEGWGTTPKRAENDAKRLVNEHRNSLMTTINDTGDRYDHQDVTDHGATQSQGPEFTFNIKENNTVKAIKFPGGRDVDLDC